MPRRKPKPIKPVESWTYTDDNDLDVTIEKYDRPNGQRGDNNRFALTEKVSVVTEKVIDDLVKKKDVSYLDCGVAFKDMCPSLGLASQDPDEEDGLSGDSHSSYRKNIYKRVKRELEILFNAIDNQPEKERNNLGRQFHRAYLKYKNKVRPNASRGKKA